MGIKRDNDRNHWVSSRLKKKYPTLTPDEVQKSLQDSVEKIRAALVRSGHVEFAVMNDNEILEFMRKNRHLM